MSENFRYYPNNRLKKVCWFNQIQIMMPTTYVLMLENCPASVTLTKNEEEVERFVEHDFLIQHHLFSEIDQAANKFTTNLRIRCETETALSSGQIFVDEQAKIAQTSGLSYQELSAAIPSFASIDPINWKPYQKLLIGTLMGHLEQPQSTTINCLKSEYQKNEELAEWFKSVCSLAFIPFEYVNDFYFEKLCATQPSVNNLDKFMEYFVSTYFENNYCIEMWNHFDTNELPGLIFLSINELKIEEVDASLEDKEISVDTYVKYAIQAFDFSKLEAKLKDNCDDISEAESISDDSDESD
ncbi:unnamed protein product [Brachionus calyciflorus]|uniref:Uncharacterized protein n=1 Tax=Brachionus calyciflorus TaxID=104777 RepID=A0A814NPL3_9BILA|nr:unnamed protein product [Brachionus calyciflorus]